MLQLKVGGEFVDLGSDPVITLEEESPVFEKDSVPGGFTFPFSLPVTERNRRIFQFPERIEKFGPMSIESDFELYHSGIVRASGTIRVTEARDYYRAFLAVGTGDFASKIKGKYLKDVSYGGERTWSNKSEFTQADDFTLFPIYNPNFLDDLPYNWSSALYKLNYYTSGSFYDTGGTFAICPFPFLSFVINSIFNQFGFTVTENVFATDPELKKLVLYSTYDATSLVTTTEQVWVEIGLDPFTREPIEELIDVTTVTRCMDTFDLVDSMPEVLISDFIKWLRNRFNIAIVFDRLNNVKIIRRDSLLDSVTFTDITDAAIGEPTVISITPPDGFKLSWEHDEDDNLFSEENFKPIDKFLDYYKGSVANTGELASITPEINDIYFIQSLESYKQYAYLDDVGNGNPGYTWIHFSIAFQNYWEGNGKEVFQSGISSLLMVKLQRVIGGPVIRCPWTEQLSNGPERKQKNPFTPRVLLYQGLQKDSNEDDVPMGSSDNLDINGNLIPGANLTLKNEGEYGIYNQLWKKYLAWWIQRKQVNWMIENPSIIDFATKYAINRNHYLLKKKTTEFTLREITPGECEFYHI